METLHFKVAGKNFSIAADKASMLKKLLPSYAPFYLPEPDDALMLRAEVIDNAVDTQATGKELGQFDCGGTNHGIYQLEDGYKIVISNEENQPAAAMLTNADFSQCTISLLGDDTVRSFGLGNAMMIAFAFSAAHHHILLMHASVTMYQNKGYLFLGKSGTGKSTHSSLWRKYIEGADLLNDDNPAVRVMEDGSIIVYGTPWSGKTPCYRNLQFPVGAFVRLEQYPQNEIRQEPVLQAFASVLSSCSTMMWDKPSYQGITRTVEGVVKRVPVFYLKCRPDEEAARLSYQHIVKD